MVKYYWSKKKFKESNATTSNQKMDNDKEWEAEASITIEEEKLALQSQYLANLTTRVIGSLI